MATFVSKKDESFREYALTAPPMKVLFSVPPFGGYAFDRIR